MARDEEMMDAEPASRGPRVRSTVTQVRKSRGRGFNDDMEVDDDRTGTATFESMGSGKSGGPAPSVEGWVVIVTGVHEETAEEDVIDQFGEFGHVRNTYLNLDRRTGFCKGYCLVEYDKRQEAENAIKNMNGQPFLEQNIQVNWCFMPGPITRGSRSRREH